MTDTKNQRRQQNEYVRCDDKTKATTGRRAAMGAVDAMGGGDGVNLQQRLHAAVWTFRQETADVFPLPGRLDSLRFAFTEAGESLDAWLRENGDYKRNREKDHDVNRELAQCLMMLLTAYGDKPYPGDDFYFNVKALDGIVVQVAYCLANFEGDGPILFAVWQICQYVPDVEQELAQALVDLKAKHMKAEVA